MANMSTPKEMNEILDIQKKYYNDSTSLLFYFWNKRIENQNNLIHELKK